MPRISGEHPIRSSPRKNPRQSVVLRMKDKKKSINLAHRNEDDSILSNELILSGLSFQIDEIIAELEVDGFLKTKNKITRKIESFRDGICESVDGDSQFFLHDDKGNVHSIQNKDALKPILNKEKSILFWMIRLVVR